MVYLGRARLLLLLLLLCSSHGVVLLIWCGAHPMVRSSGRRGVSHGPLSAIGNGVVFLRGKGVLLLLCVWNGVMLLSYREWKNNGVVFLPWNGVGLAGAPPSYLWNISPSLCGCAPCGYITYTICIYMCI